MQLAGVDRFWSMEENQFHFAEAIAALIVSFLETHESFGSVEK